LFLMVKINNERGWAKNNFWVVWEEMEKIAWGLKWWIWITLLWDFVTLLAQVLFLFGVQRRKNWLSHYHA
jgi:hypothetical protein